MPFLEPDVVAAVAGHERERAVRRRQARIELPRLRHRPARQLAARDAGREAEVVLDAAGRAGLASERRALDHERVETFRGAVDGGRQARGPAADDEQVDLLERLELAADPERAQDLAGRRRCELDVAGEAHERQARVVDSFDERCEGGVPRRVAPRVGQPVPRRELDHLHGRLRGVRADDLEPDSFDALQCLAAGHEGREEEVAQRPVFEEQRPEVLAVDRDVAERLRHRSPSGTRSGRRGGSSRR